MRRASFAARGVRGAQSPGRRCSVPRFPGPEWLIAYKEAIDSSEELALAAQGWERDITIVVEAEPDKGVTTDLWAWFDIRHGKVLDAKIVGPDEGERAQFVIY